MWKNIPAEQQDIFIYQVYYKHFIFNFITTFVTKYYYYNIDILQIRLVCFGVFSCVVVCNFWSLSYFGPKHMHRLARYPLLKAKRIMKKMNQPS